MQEIFVKLCQIEPKLEYSEEKLRLIIEDIKTIIPENTPEEKATSKISKYLCDSEEYKLAARVAIYNHQQKILSKYPTFSEFVSDNGIKKLGTKHRGFFRESFINFVCRNSEVLDDIIDHSYDFKLTSAGFDSIKSGYLLRNKNQIIELPQYLLMRNAVALYYSEGREEIDKIHQKITEDTEKLNKVSEYLDGIYDEDHDPEVNYQALQEILKKELRSHQETLKKYTKTEFEDDTKALSNIVEYYVNAREFYFISATPILSNAGCKDAPLISCFIQKLVSDSILGIGETLKNTMLLQKGNGGVSSAFHEIRAEGSIIESSGRICDGICKPMEIFEGTAHYVDQNKKRAGAHVIYLQAHHPDIFNFIYMKDQFRPVGKKRMDLFYAVWADQLFFDEVANNGYWYLMCPSSYPGLNKVYGEDFNKMYREYVKSASDRGLMIDRDAFIRDSAINEGVLDGLVLRIKARQLFTEIFKAQGNSGVPYLLNKTQFNACSNFEEIIEASNLCCEIALPFNEDTTAICCLSSIKVSAFFKKIPKRLETFEEYYALFDWVKFEEVSRLLVRNLNRVIDINKYPNELAKKGAEQYRPIGIGIQDLASLFFKMRLPFDHPLALEFSNYIEEFKYYCTLDESVELAKVRGPYPRFSTSRYKDGKLAFDLYKNFNYESLKLGLEKWDGLRKKLMIYGAANSQVGANMPNASTSVIAGSTVESREPLYSNIYTRKFSFGEYIVINEYLMEDLKELGIYSKTLMNKIMEKDGDLSEIPEIPDEIKEIYKTVYEIGMKAVIDQYAGAQRFICQSQSMNMYPKNPNIETIWATYKYAIDSQLKTICYYYRGKPKTTATKNYEVVAIEKNDQTCESCSG